MPSSTAPGPPRRASGKGRRSDEEREAIRRKERVYQGAVVLISGFICGYSVYSAWTNMDGEGGQGLLYALAVASGVVTFSSLVGICTDHHLRSTVVYFVVVLIEILLLVAFGGVCLLFTEDVEGVLEEHNIAPDPRTIKVTGASEAMKANLYVLGALALVLAFLLLRVMRLISKLIGTMRALVTLLQTMNLTMLPLGLLIIAAGFYIADSATGSTNSTDVAACIFVAIGTLTASVTFLGFLAAATESRAMLLSFAIVVSFIMSVCLATGVAAFLLTNEVEAWVANNWKTIRLSLPPTFEGRYDQVQFEAWVRANLKAAGFFAIVVGLYCASMLLAAFGLRHSLMLQHDVKVERASNLGAGNGSTLAEQRSRAANQSMDHIARALGGQTTTYYMDSYEGSGEGDAAAAKPKAKKKITRSKSQMKLAKKKMKRAWTQRWHQGSHKERLQIKICGVCLCIVCVIPISLGMTLLMYDSFCEGLAEYGESYTQAASVPQIGRVDNPQYQIHLRNTYTLGATDIKVVEGLFDGAAARRQLAAGGGGEATMQSLAAAAAFEEELPAAPASLLQGALARRLHSNARLLSGNSVEVESVVKAARGKYANKDPVRSGIVNQTLDPEGPPKEIFVELVPAPRQILVGRDISCQVGRQTLAFDEGAITSENNTIGVPIWIEAEQSINVVFEKDGFRPRFNQLRLDALLGDLTTDYMDVGSRGASFLSEQGAVEVSNMNADCAAGGRLVFRTDLGSITLKNSEVDDCGVYLSSTAGPMSLEDVTVQAAVGAALIDIRGDKGAVTMSGSVMADKIVVASGRGGISCDGIVPKRDLKLSTTEGDIVIGAQTALLQPRLSGETIQIESQTGDVTLVLSLDEQWFGKFQLSSQSGTISVRQDVLGADPLTYVTKDQGSTATDMQGAINCCPTNSCDQGVNSTLAGAGNSCSYAPELSISTISGNINLVVTKSAGSVGRL